MVAPAYGRSANKGVLQMLSVQRLNQIVDLVNQNGVVTIDFLVDKLGVSEATVRRDLLGLDASGNLQKIRGGAISIQTTPSTEPSLNAKKHLHYDEKQRIARAAVKYINHGEKICLDSGTTTLELAKLCKDSPALTAVTNDFIIANELNANKNIETLFVGGMVRRDFYSTYGLFAEQMLSEISVTKTFLSADAVDAEQGIMSYAMDDVSVKKMMIKIAKEVFLLCDHSKFDSRALINISRLENIHTIIVGKELSGDILEKLKQNGKNVELV